MNYMKQVFPGEMAGTKWEQEHRRSKFEKTGRDGLGLEYSEVEGLSQ